MGSSVRPTDDEVGSLLNMYSQLGGQVPPDAPPELKGFFDSIEKSRQEQLIRQQGQAQDSTQEIYPSPEFVVKTTDDSGRKVFINVCSSDSIQAPGNWEGGVVPENVKTNLANLENLSEADQEHMRFPLSLSEPRNDLDKQGEPCTVFDCVFNTDIIRGAQKLRALKVFLIEMAMGWISHKHSFELDARFKLPKLRYKGDTIMPQNIRKEKKSLVMEIKDVDEPEGEPSLPLRVAPIPKNKSTSTSKPPAEAGSTHADRAHSSSEVGVSKMPPAGNTQDGALPGPAKEPVNVLDGNSLRLDVKYHERPCQFVIVNVQLPPNAVGSLQDVVVRATCDSVHVKAGGMAPQVAQLNVFVKAESGRVEFEKGLLTIRLEYFPVLELLAYMRACKPFAAGTLGLASQSMLDELQ